MSTVSTEASASAFQLKDTASAVIKDKDYKAFSAEVSLLKGSASAKIDQYGVATAKASAHLAGGEASASVGGIQVAKVSGGIGTVSVNASSLTGEIKTSANMEKASASIGNNVTLAEKKVTDGEVKSSSVFTSEPLKAERDDNGNATGVKAFGLNVDQSTAMNVRKDVDAVKDALDGKLGTDLTQKGEVKIDVDPKKVDDSKENTSDKPLEAAATDAGGPPPPGGPNGPRINDGGGEQAEQADASDFRGSSLNVSYRNDEPQWVDTNKIKASIERAGFDGSLVDRAIDNTRAGTQLSSLDATLLRDMAKELDSRGMHDEANAISHLRCPNEDALKDYEKTVGTDGKETNSESVYKGADIVNREQLERTEAILDKTNLSRAEVQDYLNVNCSYNPDISDEFKNDGIIRTDIMIPEDKAVLNEKGRIDWNKYAPEAGFKLDENGKAIKHELPENMSGEQRVFDRYGSAVKGYYVSPVVDGKAYSYDERSLPYVQDEASKHTYVEVGNLNDLAGDIYKSSLSDARKSELLAELTKNGGVAFEGEISEVPAFGNNGKGGGIQVELPLSIDELLEIGTLVERK